MTYIVLEPLRSASSGAGDQAVLSAWRVSEGDHVEAGQLLASVRVVGEDVDVPAPHAGLVEEIFVPAGKRVAAGHPLARLVVF